MDILELSEYDEETLVPEFEAVNGVASVTASGLITQEVDVTIEQDRIDVLNNAILRDIDAKLADVEQQLDDAQAQISDGRSQLARMRESTLAQLDDALAQVESGEAQMDGAIATLTEQRAELQTQLDEVSAAVEQLEALTNLTDEQRELLLQLEAQLANLRAQRDELEEQLDAIEAGEADSALQAQRDEAQAQRDALADERARYEAYIADLTEGDSGALAAEIAALDGQIAEMDVEIANAQQELAAKTDARDATQAHVNELRDQIAQITGATPTPSAGATGTGGWAPDGVPLLHELGFKTAAFALTDDSVPLDDPALNAEERLALVFGTEGDGLAHDTIARCDYTVRIPMACGVDSLNVAAASAVAFWQLRR